MEPFTLQVKNDHRSTQIERTIEIDLSARARRCCTSGDERHERSCAEQGAHREDQPSRETRLLVGARLPVEPDREYGGR